MECLLFQPHPHKKKIPAECWRAKKIICKRILEKKNFIVNQGVEKKFHDQTKSCCHSFLYFCNAFPYLFDFIACRKNAQQIKIISTQPQSNTNLREKLRTT